ncbi:MAG: FKBP-type peptidyl-prolyl cis-trans isomerase [Candidatus Aenigmatarchaeota archaeon]|nr:MAG: FKBP-type peptidyl-prolyl cis-trans isomerase [Candidatus Aenigmarchaeota archaeon]
MARKKRVRRRKKFESIKERLEPIKREKVDKVVELDERKKRDVIKERGKAVPLFYAFLIVIVIAVIAVVLLSVIPLSQVNMNPVREGDIVQMGYTGELQNGTVFDSGNFTFVAGAGEVISGIEKAVLGMMRGERKTVTLSPEEAYGYYDPANILSLPLVQELDRTENTTIEVFELTFEKSPAVNSLYQISGMQWPVRVIEIRNQTVLMRHEPEDGMVFELKDSVGESYGTSHVSVRGEKITVTSYPFKGNVVTTVFGPGRITDFNETHMLMDFNHELAGETLTFEITVLNFISS